MRKIAIFMGDTSGEFQFEIVKAIKEEAEKSKTGVVVYSNAGVYGANAFFIQGEKNIINLPYLQDYEGIIVAGDTFGIDTMYEELAYLLEKQAKCPVLCLRQRDDRFSNLLLDDYSAMCEMVEHFIQHHQFTRISFMTGKLEMFDAQQRLLAYINTMQKYGLKVTSDMVFEGDYWSNKGEEAVEWFLKDPENWPQVIVCSNDYMAIAVCNALNKRGIQIPGQICVSGYDDIEETRYSIPPLSTVQIECNELGKSAFRLLKELNETGQQKKDVKVKVKPVYRNSCCDGGTWDIRGIKKLMEEKEYIKAVFYTYTSMGIAFESEDDFDSLMRAGFDYIHERGYEEIYICFCEQDVLEKEGSALQQKYSEHMVLKSILTPSDCIFTEEHFERRDILPKKYLKEDELIYVHPLHGQNRCIGYVVLRSKDLTNLRYFITRWIQEIGEALESQMMYRESREWMEMRDNYHKDALTGIGNRREMDRVLRQYSNAISETGGFCIVSVDMDDLKKINDTYGHLEGDEALCTMADILREATGKKGVAARIGGDEYLVCLKSSRQENAEEYVTELEQRIAEYNKISGKPWGLHASVGYAFCTNKNSILICMQQADKNMYEAKRIWKSTRKNKGE